jgi:hypothetical protein
MLRVCRMVRPAGAEGSATGTTGAVGADSVPTCGPLTAATVKVTGTPSARPATWTLIVAGAPPPDTPKVTGGSVVPPTEGVTRKAVAAGSAAVLQETVAVPSPGTAVTLAGAGSEGRGGPA